MCWTLDKLEFNKCRGRYNKIADEDVTVYKFGFKKGIEFAPFCYFHNISYKTHQLNKVISFDTNISLNDKNRFYIYIEEGYHSYSGNGAFSHEDDHYNDIVIYYDRQNIGSFSFLDGETYIIGKFIIPKGTEYFINNQEEIVSSQLVWTGETKLIDNIEYRRILRFSDIKFD